MDFILQGLVTKEGTPKTVKVSFPAPGNWLQDPPQVLKPSTVTENASVFVYNLCASKDDVH